MLCVIGVRVVRIHSVSVRAVSETVDQRCVELQLTHTSSGAGMMETTSRCDVASKQCDVEDCCQLLSKRAASG